MPAFAASRSHTTQTSMDTSSPRLEVREASIGSFVDVTFENFESEVACDVVKKGMVDPFGCPLIPDITVSGETNSCIDIASSHYAQSSDEFGTPRDSLFLNYSATGSNRLSDHGDETQALMVDTGLDYHRRLSASMEEISLSFEDEEKCKQSVFQTCAHSQHNYKKNLPPVLETADKNTVRSSLYNTFVAIEEMMVSPLKSFHEKVRKRLRKLSSPATEQKYENILESPSSAGSPACGVLSDEGEEEMLLPRQEEHESSSLNNTLAIMDDVAWNDKDGQERAWKPEYEIYSSNVTGVVDDQLVIPRTPWHSPIRDLRSPTDHDHVPNISWSSPTYSELFCSPEASLTFNKKSRYLCRICVPCWLEWRPKLFAFVCEFGREGPKSCVDLLLEEPNPEEHWYVVRPNDSAPPEIGDERVIHIPRGMVWVRTSRSGFLTTKARLRDIADRRPLPCTWRAVTGKSKLVRVANPRERSLKSRLENSIRLKVEERLETEERFEAES